MTELSPNINAYGIARYLSEIDEEIGEAGLKKLIRFLALRVAELERKEKMREEGITERDVAETLLPPERATWEP